MLQSWRLLSLGADARKTIELRGRSALRQLPILEVRVLWGKCLWSAHQGGLSPVVFATALHVVTGFVSEDRC